MNFLLNLDLLSVGVTIAAIGILGFIVYFQNRNSITNQSFLIFSLLTILYGFTNYLSYQVSSDLLALWLTRVVIFLAVWHSFSIFQLFYVFPDEHFNFPKNYKKLLIPLVMAIALLNLTALVFPNLIQFDPAKHIVVTGRGPVLPLFGLSTLSFVVASMYFLVKKIRNSQGPQRSALIFILTGGLITFSCIIVCNLILPTVFDYVKFIPFAGVFFFPFVALTFYSIVRYQILNVKVITTEIVTMVLAIASLLEVIVSNNPLDLLLHASVFLLILALGILLIKSVLNEIRQREQLEVLTKQLGEANEQLKALDKARSEFITIASHQLRTPPATIKWYLSALINGDYGKFKKDQLEILTKTNRTNNSLIGLIDDMLNVSRIERGKMEFLFEPANLSDLLSITYEQLLPISIEKHLKMTLSLPKKKLPQLMADKEKIRQVMNNLIDNAIKYTKEGTVAVKLETDDKEIRFSVKDSGKGITAEEQGSIFEKFSRGKESIKQSAGLGLGLYVAKIVIEQHKGKIWAESEGTGKGSTFIFTLPINSGLSQTTLVDLTKNQ